MLIKILKLFGLDVPAKVEAAKAGLELRMERTVDHVKHVAREATVIAVLCALGLAAAAMAGIVGLIALYRVTANAYGEYGALGVVGGILIISAAILVAVAVAKAKSLGASNHVRPLRTTEGAFTEAALDVVEQNSMVDARERNPLSVSNASTAAITGASASDLVEPLAFFLSKYFKFPTLGNPVVDELIGNLRVSAQGAADDAVNRAANVIRHGSRSSLFVVLSGTALVAWLLTHNSRRYS
jgi:hypothetical protein